MRPATILLTTVAITLTWLTALPCMADDAISSSVSVSPSPKKLNGDEWRAMSLAGSRILKHTDQAVTALADKKNEDALTNIGQGLKLVQIIDATLPASTVTTDIKGGGITYEDNAPVKPRFVPIYREYDTVDIISPIIAQKQAKADKIASAKRSEVPEVIYAGVDYTGVKLDLQLAKRDLQTAQDFIKQGDVKDATASLQEIMATGVIFEFSTVDQPLVRSMNNLRLAESELKSKHPDQAKVALAGASDALKNYQKLASDSRAKDVEKLRQEIDEEAKDLPQQKPEAFCPKTADWWSRCRNWLGTW